MPTDKSIKPLRAFFSFSSINDAHRIELEKHLSALRRQGLLESWSFRKILPGADWQQEEQDALETAEIFIPLITANFLASDHCNDIELKRAIERYEAGHTLVVPVIVEPCDWEHPPLNAFQALPEHAKAITEWDNPAQAWAKVASGIRAVIVSGSAQQIRPSPTAADSVAQAQLRYLQAMRQAHAYVDIRGMGAQVSERLPLDQVYTRLRVAGSERMNVAKAKKSAMLGEAPEHDQDLSQVLAQRQDVALIGDPGSGKTTFVRYVAQTLARAILEDETLVERIGLEGPPPFPLFIRLERLADFLLNHPDEDCAVDAVKHFYRFLDFQQESRGGDLPPGFLRERFTNGECFVLLDGLDEVPGDALRKRLARLIENVLVAGHAAGNRHLFTCRTRAYEGFVQVQGITTAHLAPFGPAEIEQFVRSWSRALFTARQQDTNAAKDQARDYAKELLAAIDDNPEGRRFAQSPLMLTVLAVVHWNRRQLPEQRAELYHEAIEYLLESRSDLSAYKPLQRRECLQALALAMFEDAEGVQRSVGRLDAAAVVQDELECDTPEEAIAFIEQEELHSGVLVSRTQGEVEFWHLMFQEYLAALALNRDEDWWTTIEPRLADDRWAEVILLLASCRRRDGKKRARTMIERVLATGKDRASSAFAVAQCSRMLRDIAPYGGDVAANTLYQSMLDDTLGIFEPGADPVSESVRVEVAAALGRAGDPRLSDPAANRVRIEPGQFLMGAQSEDENGPGYDPNAFSDEAPVRCVTITDGFWIGRYPVTVGDFIKFIAAGDDGYLNPALWDPSGWHWREDQQLEAPNKWESQLGRLNTPVVGVSWYEADAYARWVNGALPTEAQWEWTARGAEATRYPWGNLEPSDRHACFDSRNDQVVPVGVYGEGHTAAGVSDLSGNVLEWCADWSDDYTAASTLDPNGPESGEFRVLRGGSFFNRSDYLRAAFRLYSGPRDRIQNVGFRVVWRFPGGQTELDP
ncbi:MAG: SUMF1/EgtB/PvdO family nonheme iron enzyme [Gammaproteobacteria bacterium]